MPRTDNATTGDLPNLARPSINPALLVLLVILLAAAGSALVMRFEKIEGERELLTWQNKLNLIADSRATDIQAWLDRNFKELGSVASNPSLQLYLTEIMSQPAAQTPPAEDPAQLVFLRNLLSMTSDRLGFVDKSSKEIKSINADVRQPSGVGLAIIDTSGKVLVSTAGLPVLGDELTQKIEQAPKDQPALIDIFTAGNSTQIGFVLPIYPIESASDTPQPIGRLVAVKTVGDDLFALLHQPGATEKSLEAVLLRKEGSNAVYLSPQDNDKGAATALALNTPDLDAAYALNSPGSFSVKKDALSRATLMTSRPIARSPWVMLLHIDRDQALGESEEWFRQITYSLLLGLLAVIGFIVAVWYYGTSRRTMLLSLETKKMALRSAAQEKLLRVVSDNQLEPIMIADHDNIARFANAKAARTFDLAVEDVAGKDLNALMGGVYAKGYMEANQQALQQQSPALRTWSKENGAHTAFIRSEHIPLEHIPVEGLPEPTKGVLIIDQDITAIVKEREHRMRILRQMIDMLVHMVDKRDPYAANHSACVAMIARAVADSIGLEPALAETAEIAGKLMNIGKIVVPSALLTKAASISESEKTSIHEALQSSATLLKNIEFEGPVTDTLRQAMERIDGNGPLGLKGDAIVVTARIIAAANAFVAMVSSRSYRSAHSMEQAIQNMLENMDTQFDRRVVVALADYIENKHGRQDVLRLVAHRSGVAS